MRSFPGRVEGILQILEMDNLAEVVNELPHTTPCIRVCALPVLSPG